MSTPIVQHEFTLDEARELIEYLTPPQDPSEGERIRSAQKVLAQAAQIEAVLALHRSEDYDYEIQCVHCEGQVWPCATARALGVTE
jgi:hypothetical protein